MFCGQCGASNDDGASLCVSCGFALGNAYAGQQEQYAPTPQQQYTPTPQEQWAAQQYAYEQQQQQQYAAQQYAYEQQQQYAHQYAQQQQYAAQQYAYAQQQQPYAQQQQYAGQNSQQQNAQPAQQQAYTPMPPPPYNSPPLLPNGMPIPSMRDVKCQFCGSYDFYPIVEAGATARSWGVWAAGALTFGVGMEAEYLDRAVRHGQFKVVPMKYKCNACKKKFEAGPNVASQDELLSEPCLVKFHRDPSIFGSIVAYEIFLNGLKVALAKSGESHEFQTLIRYNAIFVQEYDGQAYRQLYRFEAEPSGVHEIRFNWKNSPVMQPV